MELRIPTKEQMTTVYHRDLKRAFPKAELKPLKELQDMWTHGVYRPWCLFDGDEIVGECFLWVLEDDPHWALLDYLCVSERARNAGLGGLILQKLQEKEKDTVIFGEVELPEYAPDSAMAVRRLNFYLRNGGRIAGYNTCMCGVPYHTLYWAEKPVEDDVLQGIHDKIYRRWFTPQFYQKYIQIPMRPISPGSNPLTKSANEQRKM